LRQTIDDYWQGQLAALKKRSVAIQPIRGVGGIVYDESPYSGIVDVRLWFNDNATLDVFEHVEVPESGIPQRNLYSYHFRASGREMRWDFDPDLPKDLQHHINRTSPFGKPLHMPAERISLVAVTEECWDMLAELNDSEGTSD